MRYFKRSASFIFRYPSVSWLLLILYNLCFAVNVSLVTCQRPFKRLLAHTACE